MVSLSAVLLYKIGAGISVSKFKIKMAHFLLHLLAFVCAVVGLVAVFQYHNAQGFGNARSLHSWMGLGTVVFYGSQASCCIASKDQIQYRYDMRKKHFSKPKLEIALDSHLIMAAFKWIVGNLNLKGHLWIGNMDVE